MLLALGRNCKSFGRTCFLRVQGSKSGRPSSSSAQRNCYLNTTRRAEGCDHGIFFRRFGKSCLSVCLSAWNNSSPTGRIFHEIWYFENLSKIWRKSSNFIINLIRSAGALHEYTFLIISCSIIRRMINVADKIYRESQTYINCSISLFDYFHFYTVQVNKIQSQTANYLH
jgi:hypothetical protein